MPKRKLSKNSLLPMREVVRPSRASPPAVVVLATCPEAGVGPRRGRLDVRVRVRRLAEREVRSVWGGGRRGRRSSPLEGEESVTFQKKERRIQSSSKRYYCSLYRGNGLNNRNCRSLRKISTKPMYSPGTPPTKLPTLTHMLPVKAAPATS